MLPRLELETATPAAVLAALAEVGALRLCSRELLADGGAGALAAAAAFFARPRADKLACGIERSPHFRGYSEMHGERDWREQLHLGRELLPEAGPEPWRRLRGPNRWPDDAGWRRCIADYLAAVDLAGQRLLALLEDALRLPGGALGGGGADGYLLLKLICYHPQPAGAAPRAGVAAHLDFSLLTLTLQDRTGGLQLRLRDGRWHDAAPAPGWLVHVGELLQFATGNRLLATPHRVVNPSAERSRVSLPAFVNPALAATVRRLLPAVAMPDGGEHVHRVLRPGHAPPFGFGEAEWRRKGENVWCEECVGG